MALRTYNLLSLLLFTLTFGIIINTVWDYGMGWDELFRYEGGDHKVTYYQNLLQGKSLKEAFPDDDLTAYPGFFDISLALLSKISPFGLFHTGHILAAFFGFMGILACWKLAYFLGGPRTAFWALLFILLTPRYYGHMFFNPKDIPFAACYAWSLFFLIKASPHFPCLTLKSRLCLGVSFGLTMAIRIGGFILFCYFGFALILALWLNALYAPSNRRARLIFRQARTLTPKVLAVAVIAFLTLLPWWPFAQQNLFSATSLTLGQIINFPWNGPVLFQGQFIQAQNLPFYYILLWLGIATPEVILALVFASLFLLPNPKRLKQIFHSNPKALPYTLLILGIFFPIVFVVLKNATLYDGMRHVLFVLPPMACLAALSLESWLLRLQNVNTLLPKILQTTTAVLLALVVISMVRLHPYQYIYFNQVIGGLPGAFMKYETDYWGTSYREAVNQLNQALLTQDAPIPKDYAIYVAQPHLLSATFFPDNFHLERNKEKADFFISTTRFGWHRASDAPIFLTVERQGIPLAIVKKLNPSSAISISKNP